MSARPFLARLLALPAWALDDHPAGRFTRADRPPFAVRLRRALLHLLLFGGLLFGGLLDATDGLTRPPGGTLAEAVYAVLVMPSMLIMAMAAVIGFFGGAALIGGLREGGGWETLRVTPGGVLLALRGGYAALIRRIARLLGGLLLLRGALLIVLLWGVSGFQGRMLDYLLLGTQPPIAPAAGLILLALGVGAGLLLPIAGLLLDCALGVLVGALLPGRFAFALAALGAIAARVVLASVALGERANWLTFAPALDAATGWRIALGGGLADGGLLLLSLPDAAALWGLLPFGAAVGVVLLVIALGQVWLADRLLVWSAVYARSVG